MIFGLEKKRFGLEDFLKSASRKAFWSRGFSKIGIEKKRFGLEGFRFRTLAFVIFG